MTSSLTFNPLIDVINVSIEADAAVISLALLGIGKARDAK